MCDQDVAKVEQLPEAEPSTAKNWSSGGQISWDPLAKSSWVKFLCVPSKEGTEYSIFVQHGQEEVPWSCEIAFWFCCWKHNYFYLFIYLF